MQGNRTVSVWNVGRFSAERRLRFAQNIIRSLRFRLVGEKFGRLQENRTKTVNGGLTEKKMHIATFIVKIIKSVGLSVPK